MVVAIPETSRRKPLPTNREMIVHHAQMLMLVGVPGITNSSRSTVPIIANDIPTEHHRRNVCPNAPELLDGYIALLL